ncbi:unnamed protein product [Dibothriocephalus latus]|uniref:Uncharacterized protein n=1 Tax=Dibothriocephalus latus TaxID=60516 RepID=A0A3P7REZ7_DIBLA|nr:unnamed protein product [Dibothriocephalus latus]
MALVILGILDLVHFNGPLGAELLKISTAVATAAIVHGIFIVAVAFLGLFGALRVNANLLIADCENAIGDVIEAELGTIGGCLIGITLLSVFASGMGFVLARNIKAYEKV